MPLGKADRTARILIAEAERTLPRQQEQGTRPRRHLAQKPLRRASGVVPRRAPYPRTRPRSRLSDGDHHQLEDHSHSEDDGPENPTGDFGVKRFQCSDIPFSSVLCSMTASLPGLGVRFTTGEAQGWALVSATDRLRQRGSAAGSGLARAHAAPGRCLSGETSGASSYDDRLSEPSWAEYQTRRSSIT